MAKFRVWCPDVGTIEDALTVDARDAEEAVELWAHRDHPESDYWEESTAMVLADGRDEDDCELWHVVAHRTTIFHARPA